MSTTPPGHDAWRFEVDVAGSKSTQAEPMGLEHLEVEDHLDLVGVARITYNLENPSWSAMAVGSEVSISVGTVAGPLFQGFVTGVRHTRKRGRELLTVLAMDPQVKLMASRRTRTWNDQTDSDVASAVLGGLAGQIDPTTEVRGYTMQRNESDLDFVKRLAARSDRQVVARAGKIDFVKPQFSGGGIELTDEVVEDLDVSVSPLQVPPNLTAYGWDPVKAEMVEGSAGDGDLQAIGKGELATAATARLWGDASYLSDVQLEGQADAKDHAVAELNRLSRSLVRGTAVVVGRGDLRAGMLVSFPGQREGFNFDGLVVSSRHVFDVGRGYSTELRFCCNTMPT